MSMNKLLVSAAASALIAGSAAALGLTQGDADGAQVFTPSASVVYYTAAGTVAEEATFAAVGSENGVFELRIGSTGTFAAGENYFVDVTVSGGTFSQDLTGNEVTDGSVGGSITGSSIQIAGQTQTGQDGETQVRFLVSTDNLNTTNNFGLELPIAYDGCPSDLTFTVSVQTSGGITFEEGTATLATPALTCGNAFEASIASDVVAGANDSFLSSTTFTNLEAGVTTSDTDAGADSTTTAGPADSTTVGTFGVVTVEFNPDALAGVTEFITQLASPATVVDGDPTGQSELDTVDFDVVVSDPSGVEAADLEEGASTDTFSAGGVASLSLDADVDVSANDIVENVTLDINAAAVTAVQVAQQGVTTTNGVLNFADPTLIDSEPVADATLDDLNYEGETCGTFDWVGDATRPTANIWRVTGFGPATSDVVATLSNSSAGASFNGSQTLTASFDFSGSEVVITNSMLSDVFGNFGRADVLFNFIGATTSLDCDRLMNSDAENIITAFGNNNTFGGATVTTTDGDD